VRVLFDQGTPAPLRRALTNHSVETAFELGWSKLRNGELIAAAEQAGFEVFVTTDKNLKYQQNLANRTLAIVVLGTTSWPRLQMSLPKVIEAVNRASKGSYEEVTVEGERPGG
jgi:glutamate racemase